MDLKAAQEGVTLLEEIWRRPMTRRQILAVAICIIVNLMDGFDVLASAFTAPVISEAWHLTADKVGVILSAGALGMAIGALFLSPLADRFGRRSMASTFLCVTAVGMFGAGFSSSLWELVFARVLTGVGIGGTISAIGAAVVEVSSYKSRGLVLGLMAVGFPAGATLGGLAAMLLIEHHGWQSVFVLGGIVTCGIVPFVSFLIPESIDVILTRQGPKTLGQLNQALGFFGGAPHRSLPKAGQLRPRTTILTILRRPLLPTTVQVSAIMLLSMLSFYFVLNWAPKLAVEGGLSKQAGIATGMLINIGGMVGGLATGVLLRYVPLRISAILILFAMAAQIALYGILSGHADWQTPLALILGLVMYSSIVVTYMLMTTSFPTVVRATAIGFCSTAGRLGSIGGPYLGGLLLLRGFPVEWLCVTLAIPVAGAGLIVLVARPLEPA